MNEEIAKLRLVLARLERGRGKRYRPALRARIGRAAEMLRTAGMSWQKIGTAFGIPHETVRRFCGADGGRAGFIPVSVVMADVPRTTTAVGAMALVSPEGYRIEGLDVERAADLLRRLR